MSNIFVLTGQEEERDKFGYDGMPEFVQEKKEAYAEFYVRFRNEEDLREFANKIGIPQITKKTRAIWYPILDRKANSLLRWVDEETVE